MSKSQEQTFVLVHGHRHRFGLWHEMQAGKSKWAELRCIFCNRTMDRRSHAPQTTSVVDLMRYCSIGWLARLSIAAIAAPTKEPQPAAE